VGLSTSTGGAAAPDAPGSRPRSPSTRPCSEASTKDGPSSRRRRPRSADARAQPRPRGTEPLASARTRWVMPDRVIGAFPQDLAAVVFEVAFEVSTPQAAARSIVTCSACPPPIGGSRP
jgi:hypothetical protein